MKRVVSLLCLFALCLFMGFSAMAQSENGSIIGTVLDPDGKAVVGATVTVTDVTTNQTLPPTKTTDGGKFAVNDLPPGHYRVTVAMANFKTSISDDVEVIMHRTFELPIKLEVGQTTVNVEVTIGQQSMETQNTSTQQTITGRSITNLPLVSRSALMLAVLDPGAQSVGGPRNSTFEGLPKGAINITFDGINAQCNLLKSSDGFFSINDPRIDD
ncbi:MAG TPA: carboxypeptidase-like regulatory domain-containing protein, partial [Candidatus Acidoferrales bacterium]